MKRSSYQEQAHKELDLIFLKAFPERGMAVRKEQIQLSHQMLDALFGNQIALCDAAVGVGKTYAYLAACVMLRKYGNKKSFIYGQEQPVVISTSSIALQEAIVKEYVPFLSDVLEKNGLIHKPLQAVVRKGKEHFVCDNRLEIRLEAVRKKAKNPEQKKALLSLRTTCDMDNVQHLSGFDRRLVCVPKFCPMDCFMRNQCRYQRYLTKAGESSIFFQICNHNYLLADAIHRSNGYRPLLNDYRALIVDEAHKLPEAAQQMYGTSFSGDDFDEICSFLEQEHYTHIARNLREHFRELQESVKKPRERTEQTRFAFTLTQGRKDALNACIRWLKRACSLTVGAIPRWLYNRLEESRELLLRFLSPSHDMVLFLEYTPKGVPVFCTASRRTEELLCRDLWDRGFPAILTSGTLMSGNGFGRTKQVMGLENVYRVAECAAPSPFCYEDNCLLYFPRIKKRDMDGEAQMRWTAAKIRELVGSTFGHTLVLFTSYAMMGSVYKELKDTLSFPVLKVWKDSQSVIREFKRQENCVLFAAGSCWEGVDFPGDVVSSLIIVKLPFAVPDPIREAEREKYGSLKEYIREIIVPDMQKKLRQGFGRAIRTETDTCVVSILDERAAEGGRYHKAVLDALPDCGVTNRMMDVERFIRNQKSIDYYM